MYSTKCECAVVPEGVRYLYVPLLAGVRLKLVNEWEELCSFDQEWVSLLFCILVVITRMHTHTYRKT
jgi:hypothetical protein